MAACEITPLSAFLSTNLSNKIDCYGRLGDRIKRSLGYPLVSIGLNGLPPLSNDSSTGSLQASTIYGLVLQVMQLRQYQLLKE